MQQQWGLYFGNSDKGLQCDACHKFLKSSAMKLLRHRPKERADLFQRAVKLQYKAYLMKLDVEK